MKKFMISTALVVATGFAAQAQEQFRSAADPLQIPASELVGMRVYASEAAVDATEYAGVQDGWDDIGEVNEIMLNRDGSVDSVLVDIGGFLGMGERQVAVGMESLRFVSDSATPDDLDDYFLVLNANRAIIEGAPVYENTSMGTPVDGTVIDPMTPAADEEYAAVDLATLTTDALVGASVYGPGNASIGEVSEVRMSGDQTIETLLVDVGGFLGIGEKTVALPIGDVAVTRKADSDDLRVQVSMTEDQLKAMPAVN